MLLKARLVEIISTSLSLVYKKMLFLPNKDKLINASLKKSLFMLKVKQKAQTCFGYRESKLEQITHVVTTLL